MKLNVDAICHKGLVRENNEDALSVNGLFLRDDTVSMDVETPEKGAVYYDGKDLSKLDLPSLRRRIGAVTQDGTNTSLAETPSKTIFARPHVTLHYVSTRRLPSAVNSYLWAVR